MAPPPMMRRGLGRSASAAAIAADWQELQIARRETFRQVLAKFPRAALRQELSLETAIDTPWAIASPDTHELFVQRCRWTYDQYQTWIASTLIAALVSPEWVKEV